MRHTRKRYFNETIELLQMSSMVRPRLLFNEVEGSFPNAIHGLHRDHGLLWMACSMGPELSPRMQSSTYSVSITILLQWSPGLLPRYTPSPHKSQSAFSHLQWSLESLPGYTPSADDCPGSRACFNGAGITPGIYKPGILMGPWKNSFNGARDLSQDTPLPHPTGP